MSASSCILNRIVSHTPGLAADDAMEEATTTTVAERGDSRPALEAPWTSGVYKSLDHHSTGNSRRGQCSGQRSTLFGKHCTFHIQTHDAPARSANDADRLSLTIRLFCKAVFSPHSKSCESITRSRDGHLGQNSVNGPE